MSLGLGLRPTAGHPHPRGFTPPYVLLSGVGRHPARQARHCPPLASLVVVPAAPVHRRRGAGAGRAVEGLDYVVLGISTFRSVT